MEDDVTLSLLISQLEAILWGVKKAESDGFVERCLPIVHCQANTIRRQHMLAGKYESWSYYDDKFRSF